MVGAVVSSVQFPKTGELDGCREREIAVIVSEVGVGGLRPVMPGVFILRRWAKSRL